MKKPPRTIYLQWYGDNKPRDAGEIDGVEITWCIDQIFEHDVKYVRVPKKRRRKKRPS